MRIAAGTRAWNRVREAEPMVRKIMDMTMTVAKLMSQKKKKAPGSRRRLVIKYSVTLKMIEFIILYGRSQSIEEIASADG